MFVQHWSSIVLTALLLTAVTTVGLPTSVYTLVKSVKKKHLPGRGMLVNIMVTSLIVSTLLAPYDMLDGFLSIHQVSFDPGCIANYFSMGTIKWVMQWSVVAVSMGYYKSKIVTISPSSTSPQPQQTQSTSWNKILLGMIWVFPILFTAIATWWQSHDVMMTGAMSSLCIRKALWPMENSSAVFHLIDLTRLLVIVLILAVISYKLVKHICASTNIDCRTCPQNLEVEDVTGLADCPENSLPQNGKEDHQQTVQRHWITSTLLSVPDQKTGLQGYGGKAFVSFSSESGLYSTYSDDQKSNMFSMGDSTILGNRNCGSESDNVRIDAILESMDCEEAMTVNEDRPNCSDADLSQPSGKMVSMGKRLPSASESDNEVFLTSKKVQEQSIESPKTGNAKHQMHKISATLSMASLSDPQNKAVVVSRAESYRSSVSSVGQISIQSSAMQQISMTSLPNILSQPPIVPLEPQVIQLDPVALDNPPYVVSQFTQRASISSSINGMTSREEITEISLERQNHMNRESQNHYNHGMLHTNASTCGSQKESINVIGTGEGNRTLSSTKSCKWHVCPVRKISSWSRNGDSAIQRWILRGNELKQFQSRTLSENDTLDESANLGSFMIGNEPSVTVQEATPFPEFRLTRPRPGGVSRCWSEKSNATGSSSKKYAQVKWIILQAVFLLMTTLPIEVLNQCKPHMSQQNFINIYPILSALEKLCYAVNPCIYYYIHEDELQND